MKKTFCILFVLVFTMVINSTLIFSNTAMAEEKTEWSTSMSTSDLLSIAHNGIDLYVLVGSNGTIRTSSDGEHWVNQKSGTKSILNRVIWDGKQFIAVGNDGVILA